jgi:hypothetical protein
LWRNIRAEMPPPELVAAAASARAGGDWRAAAALMPVTVDVDLAGVHARFGAGAADRLEDDLRHLALDLLWWHLPRHRGGRSTLQAQVAAVLAPRARASWEPLLHLRLPQSPTGPQRAHLSVVTLADLRDQRWYYAPRYTWDVRETEGLAEQWAAPEVFALLAAGDYHQAWRHCGITLDFDDLSCLQRPATSPTSPVGVATLAREAAEAFGVDRVATMLGAYLTLHVSSLRAEPSDPSEYLEIPVRIPTTSVPPDLALLAAGLLSPSDLHPLIRDVATKSPTLRDRTFRTYTLTGDLPDSLAFFRSRCGGVWHRLTITGGALTLLDHDEPEQRREAALRALGGESHGCYAVEQAWQQGGPRLPKALHEYRRGIMHRLQFGDTEYLLRGLAGGTIDPRMRANNGWSLLHMAIWLDHERALPALLAAGVPVDGADRIGRTPLYEAVMQGGSPELIRGLLAAGADPMAETVHGATPRYAARNYSNGRDLSFLANS